MNTRAFTLALVIALLAMFMVSTYIDDEKQKMVKKFGVESAVVVAKVDIHELELIDDSKVRVISVPKNFLSPGHFKSIKEIENTVATVPILKGEQITKPRVTYPGSKTGLSRQISAGKRGFAINVNEMSGVGKLIKPGDRVDVIAPIDYKEGRLDAVKAQTVLQDVLVLSTGVNMTNSLPIIGIKTPKVIRKMNVNTYTKYNTITLELNPFEVQKVVFLNRYVGGLYLSLRNNGDKNIERIRATKLFDLLGESAEEAKGYFAEKYKKR